MRLIKLKQVICIFIWMIALGAIQTMWGRSCKVLYPVPNSMNIEPPYGYIDCHGKVVVPMEYDMAFDFNDGVAVAVKGNNSELHFLNGQVVRISGVKLLTNFAEGLAIGKRGDRYVLVNKAGKVTARLPKEVEEYIGFTAGNFSEGLAQVYAREAYRYVDRNGKFAFAHEFGITTRFASGMASGWLDGNVVLINRQGEFIIPPRPIGEITMLESSDGLVRISGNRDENTGRRKVRYVNNRGEEVLKTDKYQATGIFSEGMAAVYADGKWGYINKDGVEVIPLKYEGVSPFSEGLAAVSLDGIEYGFIDKLGNFVISPVGLSSANYPFGFRNGLVYVFKKEGDGRRFEGYIDRSGKWIWKRELNDD